MRESAAIHAPPIVFPPLCKKSLSVFGGAVGAVGFRFMISTLTAVLGRLPWDGPQKARSLSSVLVQDAFQCLRLN